MQEVDSTGVKKDVMEALLDLRKKGLRFASGFRV